QTIGQQSLVVQTVSRGLRRQGCQEVGAELTPLGSRDDDGRTPAFVCFQRIGCFLVKVQPGGMDSITGGGHAGSAPMGPEPDQVGWTFEDETDVIVFDVNSWRRHR